MIEMKWCYSIEELRDGLHEHEYDSFDVTSVECLVHYVDKTPTPWGGIISKKEILEDNLGYYRTKGISSDTNDPDIFRMINLSDVLHNIETE
jgi:hypothetical protein